MKYYKYGICDGPMIHFCGFAKMKIVLVLLCIVGVAQALPPQGVAQATQLGRKAGLCAELCGRGCPQGSTCQSNGCGHSCVPDRGTVSSLDSLKTVAQAKRWITGTGICVEKCSPLANGGSGNCPSGYKCKSNGCGHICQKNNNLSKLNMIAQAKRLISGLCVEMCSIAGSENYGSCPTGYECKSNGCRHTCYLPADVSKKYRKKC